MKLQMQEQQRTATSCGSNMDGSVAMNHLPKNLTTSYYILYVFIRIVHFSRWWTCVWNRYFVLFDLFAPNHKLNEPFFFFFASVYKSARDSQHKNLYIHAKLKWLPTWHKSCAKLGDGDFNLVARSWDTPTGINFVSDGCADMLAFGWA